MQFKFNHIIYFCADMKKMAQFYTEVMGLRPVPNEKYPPEEWLEMEGGAFKLCLHKSGKPGSPQGNRNKIVFQVDDVGAARAYLISKKVPMGVHHRWGAMEASDGRDPEGNKFQIAGPAK